MADLGRLLSGKHYKLDGEALVRVVGGYRYPAKIRRSLPSLSTSWRFHSHRGTGHEQLPQDKARLWPMLTTSAGHPTAIRSEPPASIGLSEYWRAARGDWPRAASWAMIAMAASVTTVLNNSFAVGGAEVQLTLTIPNMRSLRSAARDRRVIAIAFRSSPDC